MSLTLYHNSNRSNVTGHGRQKHQAHSITTASIGKKLRYVVGSAGQLIVTIYNAIAEARLNKALLEAELYRNRYMHTSKNDDDLPLVR